MPLYQQGKDVFVDIGNGKMLCIGTESDIKDADNAKINEMIRDAVALSYFRQITSAKGMTKH